MLVRQSHEMIDRQWCWAEFEEWSGVGRNWTVVDVRACRFLWGPLQWINDCSITGTSSWRPSSCWHNEIHWINLTSSIHRVFCSLTILDLRVGHTLDVLSPFISVLCHSDWLFHGESCPRIDVVYPGRAWSSSPACTWHCSLHYLFLQATPLFPRCVTIVC